MPVCRHCRKRSVPVLDNGEQCDRCGYVRNDKHGLEVMQVIRTSLKTRGMGDSPNDPVREVTQYWDMDGNLLWEEDPYGDSDS